MIGWIIFGVVLALLAVLLLSNVRVVFRYENSQILLQLRWWFLQYQIVPEKEKKAKKRKKQKDPLRTTEEKALPKAKSGEKAPSDLKDQKNGKKREAADKQSRDLQEMTRMAKDIFQSAKKPLKMLYRHLWMKKLNLQLVVAREDAAQTAIAYGQMNGWVYGAWATCSHLIHMKKGKVQVLADYLSVGDRLCLSFQLHLRVLFLLAFGIRFAGSFLWKQIKK